MKESQGDRALKLALSFFLVYFGWGSLYLAIRIAVQSFPPFLMAGASTLAAGLFLYIVSMIRGTAHPKLSQWKNALVAAVAMLAIGNGCVAWAEQKVPSAITALILATEPAWLALLAWIFFKEKKPALGAFAGIAVGFLGVSLLVGDGLTGVQTFPLSDAFLVLGAAVAWSWGSLFFRRADLSRSSLMAVAMLLSLGGILLLMAGTGAGEWRHLDIRRLPKEAIYAFLYIVFVSNIATYAAYLWLLKNVSTSLVSTYAYANPLVALGLGVWFANEPLTMGMAAGGAAILVSVVLILKFSRSNPTGSAR